MNPGLERVRKHEMQLVDAWLTFCRMCPCDTAEIKRDMVALITQGTGSEGERAKVEAWTRIDATTEDEAWWVLWLRKFAACVIELWQWKMGPQEQAPDGCVVGLADLGREVNVRTPFDEEVAI